jgi:hypothetical protein
MPLKTGRSDSTVSQNIRTEVHQFERTGRIGTSHPASRKAAVAQAVAIALSKAGRSRAGSPAASRPGSRRAGGKAGAGSRRR